MNLTTLMMIGENITKDSPISERAAVGLQVVGIGMGVVFGVLVLLIGILQLFKIFAVKKPVDNKDSTPASVSSTTVAPAPVSAPSAPASEEEQLVAIATAAIAAYRGESECSFNVISIKKIVK